MPIQTEGIVLKNENIKSNYYILEIECPPIAREIRPGQFIMLKVSDDRYPLLRRPFSLYRRFSIPGKRDRIFSIIYKVVGKGTKEMTEFQKGQKIDIIGPLGNGFTPPPLPPPGNIILVGGGVGIVTLYPLTEILKDYSIYVFIGGKTEDDILCLDDFKKKSSKIYISTEDGSLGFKGTVLKLFSNIIEAKKIKNCLYIYTCGPSNMLKEFSKRLKNEDIPCQASFESRMACGFGACWGCVIKTKNSLSPYQRVCKDGPVFNLNYILWDDL